MTALRSSTVVLCLSALTTVLWPTEAIAQRTGRRAVPRQRAVVVRTSPVFVRARPVIYGSWSIGRPYGWNPRYGYGGYLYGRYPYAYGGVYDGRASVRVQVPQRNTEVYVDGYYAGIVDDFDGIFQRLHVEPGEHEIALFLPDHQTVSQQVYLQPRSTFRIQETMEPLRPGDPPAVRPAPDDPTRVSDPRGRRQPARGGAIVERPITPPTEPREEAAGFGTLSLQVQPADAQVIVDGDSWERTGGVARLLLELTTGTHRVEIRRPGHVPFESSITIDAGDTTALNVSLSPDGGV